MSDLLRALAFAYRRKGERAMAANALRLMLAFDLNWFAPADAKRLVERATQGGLLVEEGEALRIAFDPARVDVPVGFRPTPAALEEPLPALPEAPPEKPEAPEAAAESPAAEPATASAQPEDDDAIEREAQAERARRGGLLTLEVARLVVRRRRGEDVAPLLAEAEQSLLARPGGAPPRA